MQLRLLGFDGDIFQKMDAKTFIYRFLDLDYIQAEALIEGLQAGQMQVFTLADDALADKADFLTSLGFSFDFGAAKPAKKASPQEDPAPLLFIPFEENNKEPLKIAVPQNVAPALVSGLDYVLYFDYPDVLLKFVLAQLFRECGVKALTLKESLALALQLINQRKLSIEINAAMAEDFNKRALGFGLRYVIMKNAAKKAKK